MKPFWFFGIPLRGVLVLMFLVGCIIAWPAFLATAPASAIYNGSTFVVTGLMFFLTLFPRDDVRIIEPRGLRAIGWFFVFISIGTWLTTAAFTDSFSKAGHVVSFNSAFGVFGIITGAVSRLILLGARAGFEWAFRTEDPEKKEE